MVSRNFILVEPQLAGNNWTPGTAAAIDQAGMLASSSQAAVHLLTADDVSPTEASPDASSVQRPESHSPHLQELHSATASALQKIGVEMTSALIRGKSKCPAGQPAPITFAFLSLPDLLAEENIDHRSQVLEECRNDLWLASPGAFDKDIPCLVVYDDFTADGEQALRAAVSAAQQFQARLLVTHATLTEPSDSGKEELESKMLTRLFGTDFRTLDQGTRRYIGCGTAKSVLLDAVREFEASLVVISWPDGPVDAKSIDQFLHSLNELKCSLLLVRTHETVD